MKTVIASLVFVSVCAATSAHATVFGNTDNSTTNAPVAHGGNASAGAQAGAIAGAAAGAAVVGSGNSSNTNRNNNANVQGQQQGQQQGQAQSSRNSNRNTSTSTSRGGAGGEGGLAVGGNVTTGAVANRNDGNNVTINGDQAGSGAMTMYAAQERAPASTAYAAPLTSSPETCMGSSSGGAQGANFGVTFSTTWESVKCDRRMNARALQSLGKATAALSLLCQDKDVQAALEATGEKCPAVVVRASATSAPVATSSAVQPQYQDPIIRSRLGLPPLN